MKASFIFCNLFSIFALLNYNVKYCKAILNGRPVREGEYPYMVSLRDEDFKHRCGGALITRRHVITSADCIYSNVSEILSVVVDSIISTPYVKNYPENKIYLVEESVIYPDYEHWRPVKIYNIGIVTLKKEVRNQGVTSVKVASAEPSEGQIGNVVGFGIKIDAFSAYHGHEITTSILSRAKVEIGYSTKCDYRQLKKIHLYNNVLIPPYMFCTVPDGYYAACSGDEGSPLVVDNELVGIVLWEACNPAFPIFYTTVGPYMDFIMDIIKEQFYNEFLEWESSKIQPKVDDDVELRYDEL